MGNTLVLNGCPVPTVPLKEGLSDFINFLKSHDAQVVLVCHNAKSCDAAILCTCALQVGLADIFSETVIGFLDTLPLLKEAYPGLASYAQKALADQLLFTSYNEHNAMEDCTILSSLYSLVISQKPDISIIPFTFTTKSVMKRNSWKTTKKKNSVTFSPIVNKKHMSSQMEDPPYST